MRVKLQIPAGSRLGGTLGAGWHMRYAQCRGPTGVVVTWGRDGARCGPGWDGRGRSGRVRGGGEEAQSGRCRVGSFQLQTLPGVEGTAGS